MRKIAIISVLFLFASCGATANITNNSQEGTDTVSSLPPNTASNKYSKVRKN